MKVQIIGLTHYYSKLRGVRFYAVRTHLNREDLNLAIAYLQLLREKLPDFETVDDVLGEVEGVELLSLLYECEPLISDFPLSVNSEIDFCDNWSDYALPTNNKTRIGRLARPGAKLAIVLQMYKSAMHNQRRYPTTKRLEIVKQLEAISNGAKVSDEWGLKSVDGNSYVGMIISSDQPDLL